MKCVWAKICTRILLSPIAVVFTSKYTSRWPSTTTQLRLVLYQSPSFRGLTLRSRMLYKLSPSMSWATQKFTSLRQDSKSHANSNTLRNTPSLMQILVLQRLWVLWNSNTPSTMSTTSFMTTLLRVLWVLWFLWQL